MLATGIVILTSLLGACKPDAVGQALGVEVEYEKELPCFTDYEPALEIAREYYNDDIIIGFDWSENTFGNSDLPSLCILEVYRNSETGKIKKAYFGPAFSEENHLRYNGFNHLIREGDPLADTIDATLTPTATPTATPLPTATPETQTLTYCPGSGGNLSWLYYNSCVASALQETAVYNEFFNKVQALNPEVNVKDLEIGADVKFEVQGPVDKSCIDYLEQ